MPRIEVIKKIPPSCGHFLDGQEHRGAIKEAMPQMKYAHRTDLRFQSPFSTSDLTLPLSFQNSV
jgi:hypothetical protein